MAADSENLATVYMGFRRALARVIGRIVRPTDVEDILQEAFVRSFEAGRDGQIRDARAFLLRTATNLALNHIARKEHRTTGQLDDLAPEDTPASEALPLDVQIDVDRKFLAFCRAVGSLPEQCRRAFILKKIYGLSQQEIAQELGISESTVEKHIARGLLQCRERLLGPRHDSGAAPQMRSGT